MARRKGGGAAWWIAGGVVVVGATGGAVALYRRRTVGSTAASPGSTVTVQTQPGTTIAPATKSFPSVQQTLGNTGITTSNSEAPPPTAVTGAPSTTTTAPRVHSLTITRLSTGNVLLDWTGTHQALYQGDYGYGYDLFILQNGKWSVLQGEVEPTLTVRNVKPGTVLGIAPVYLTPAGHVIPGQIRTVTV